MIEHTFGRQRDILNQSVSQSINQSITQVINWLIDWLIDLINQSIQSAQVIKKLLRGPLEC